MSSTATAPAPETAHTADNLYVVVKDGEKNTLTDPVLVSALGLVPVLDGTHDQWNSKQVLFDVIRAGVPAYVTSQSARAHALNDARFSQPWGHTHPRAGDLMSFRPHTLRISGLFP